MEDVVIVDAARSPVGRKNGSRGGAHPTDVPAMFYNDPAPSVPTPVGGRPRLFLD